nr:MAG TPA: hypothetical protein [Caudoviricetes sp.]DAP05037.1 MAG TPA: hypothetical protein [Caudoviricetes sp.]DAP56018.1 MAG TPA: hypothetical protein [Caudoviricetes sp.]DAW44327.1 MAG TPA: hypothetical protein [Caudoviricetes sp.]
MTVFYNKSCQKATTYLYMCLFFKNFSHISCPFKEFME